MADLAVFLRDFHSGAIITYDVAVLDFLAAVMSATGQNEARILSAYRARETNEMLARTTFGVAENSQHIYSRALDVRLGTKLLDAMQVARAMRRGGVGWYPHSGFLHIDCGPVRNWESRRQTSGRFAERYAPATGRGGCALRGSTEPQWPSQT